MLCAHYCCSRINVHAYAAASHAAASHAAAHDTSLSSLFNCSPCYAQIMEYVLCPSDLIVIHIGL